jgi:hypothetical protein
MTLTPLAPILCQGVTSFCPFTTPVGVRRYGRESTAQSLAVSKKIVLSLANLA